MADEPRTTMTTKRIVIPFNLIKNKKGIIKD